MEQQEIELDRRRWYKAWKMLRDKPDAEIRHWLTVQPESKRKDMARRLNAIRSNDNEKA
jgi:hypothetical protein